VRSLKWENKREGGIKIASKGERRARCVELQAQTHPISAEIGAHVYVLMGGELRLE